MKLFTSNLAARLPDATISVVTDVGNGFVSADTIPPEVLPPHVFVRADCAVGGKFRRIEIAASAKALHHNPALFAKTIGDRIAEIIAGGGL